MAVRQYSCNDMARVRVLLQNFVTEIKLRARSSPLTFEERKGVKETEIVGRK